MLSNLWNAAANTGDGHYVKESSLLTCTTITKTLGVDINIHGPSMDQVAAQRAGDQTPLPSLELGIEPESTGVDANVGLHACVRVAHRLERPDHAAGARDQSAIGLRAAVPGGRSRGRRGEAGHAAARPRAGACEADAGEARARPIGRASMSI